MIGGAAAQDTVGNKTRSGRPMQVARRDREEALPNARWREGIGGPILRHRRINVLAWRPMGVPSVPRAPSHGTADVYPIPRAGGKLKPGRARRP
jgi:hypothetical protein